MTQGANLKIYNTLTKNVENFEPVEPGKVKMYVCGPTVYDLLHIGNFRGPIFFNLVRNWLTKIGYEVTYVYNYTDVDDKIINRSNEEGVSAREISEKYIKEFETDFGKLKLRSHDHNPKVTDFMDQIISFVKDLVENESAYVIDGEVFYSIDKFESYGKLSGKKLDELEAGQRVEVDQRKQNPLDFVLWKPAKEGEPSWDSPWGKGRPGWHIECSAMIQSILGETIDIHGGGIDLIFPHHENEIAQGEARTCKHYSKYWMHNNFINLKDQKMSKSLGNVIKGRDFIDEFGAEVMKFVMLSTHYRALLNVTDEKIKDAMSGLNRIYQALANAESIQERAGELQFNEKVINPNLKKEIETHNKNIEKCLNDDFNTVGAISGVFEVVRVFNGLNLHKKKLNESSFSTAKYFKEWVKGVGELFSLFNEPTGDLLENLQTIAIKKRGIDISEVEELIKKRKSARDAKDWAAADQVRDELDALGIEIQDGGSGRNWSVKF